MPYVCIWYSVSLCVFLLSYMAQLGWTISVTHTQAYEENIADSEAIFHPQLRLSTVWKLDEYQNEFQHNTQELNKDEDWLIWLTGSWYPLGRLHTL